jgi:hypothetical protein
MFDGPLSCQSAMFCDGKGVWCPDPTTASSMMNTSQVAFVIGSICDRIPFARRSF